MRQHLNKTVDIYIYITIHDMIIAIIQLKRVMYMSVFVIVCTILVLQVLSLFFFCVCFFINVLFYFLDAMFAFCSLLYFLHCS